MGAIRFVFGLLFGSFINVISLRYRPGKFLLDPEVIGGPASTRLGEAGKTGRSRCPKCGKELSWYELFPVLSFLFLKGRCSVCREKISFQYPIVEIISGFIFFLTPTSLGPHETIFSSIIWIAVFELLLILALIDFRLQIIPDELSVFLCILGVLNIFIESGGMPGFGALFVSNILVAFGVALFFGGLFYITRGRGMGMGDVKFAFPLGFLFGWPQTAVLVGLAFVIGAACGLILIALKKKNMKSVVPFGPFLAVAAAIVFFFGPKLLNFYIYLLGK